MRIGVFIESLDPLLGGGYTIENEILNALIIQFKKSNHTPVIFSNSEIKIAGIETVKFQANKITKLKYKLIRGFHFLNSQRDHLRYENYRKSIIQKSRIDVFFYLHPLTDFYIDIPYISIVWDLQHCLQPYFPEFCKSGEFNKRQMIFNKKLRQSAYIITGTEVGKNELSHFYNVWLDRIKVIPIPTPSYVLDYNSNVSIDVINKYNLRKKFIFYPAQFWPHKNHINLLKALKILIFQKKQEIDLVLVGSDKGNKGYILEFVGENNLNDYVKFLGFVSKEDLIALYKQSMALTFVTFFGPDNLPPLEAFALGCPVIASNVAGAEDQLGDAAMLVDANEPTSIADAIECILMQPEKTKSMIEKGKLRAAQRNSQGFALEFMSILKEFEPIRGCWK